MPGSVGTILAATVIFALAAFAPWALMYLLAADAESAYTTASLRGAAGAAVASEHGRSARTAGGLRNSSAGSSAGGSGRPAGGGPGSGGNGGGGRPLGKGSGGSGGPSVNASGAASDSGVSEQPEDRALAVGAGSIGAGSVGAAAGASARVAGHAAQSFTAPDSGSHARPADGQAVGSDSETRTGSALAAVPDAPPAGHGGRPAAAGGAQTGAPLPRRGSAGTPTNTQPEQNTASSSDDTGEGGGVQPLARSPRRAGSRPLALVHPSTPAHPTGEGEEEPGGGE